MRSVRDFRDVETWGIADFFGVDFGNVGFKSFNIVLMYQRDSTASKSGTCHTSTKNASLFPCCMDEGIEFLSSDLVIKIGREVTLVHETSKVGEVAFF